MKKITLIMICLCALLFSGCSEALLEDYITEQSNNLLFEELQNYMYADGLSDDLCIMEENAEFDPSFVLSKSSALFAEDQKKVLYANKLYDKINPASLTKCMTALLVLEHFDDLETKITITDDALDGLSGDASLAQLEIGGTYTVHQLLYALLVPSGNDAANALAAAVSGSVGDFVNLMNLRARELGLTGTHFANPHGLHSNEHYSTAFDLYVIFHNCLNFSEFKDIIGTKTYVCDYVSASGNTASQTYGTTNSYTMGYTVPDNNVMVMGGKTGYTASAGRCLILYVKDANGASYIAVILGAEGYDVLYEQMNVLLTAIDTY